MLNEIIIDNYGLQVNDLKLIDSHFGTKIFLMETSTGKYIIKTIPLNGGSIEKEGYITEFLYNNGISVARLLKTKNNMYHVETNEYKFHIQEFIEGETLKVNTAPDWFLKKSALVLGKINCVLSKYDELDINFGKDFFTESNANGTIDYYNEKLNEAVGEKNSSLVFDLEERIKHLKRISAFNIDTDKLTYSNSHGDYHIGQIITRNEELTVIDWTSACKLPLCLEVIMSYTTADPECKNGKIDCNRLKEYIDEYLKNFSLNSYDIQMMPYIFYFQQILCHYQPPYQNVAETYKPICDLINNFTKWLYKNVETLSKELCMC